MLAKLIENKNIFIISDEVYDHIVFDKQEHWSVLRFPELAAKAFVIGSFGKFLHMTGWKVGYTIAPADLTLEFRKIHQFVTFSTSTPFQHAIARYLEIKPDLKTEVTTLYQQKRDYFRELLKNTPLIPLETKGSYFQLASFRNVSTARDTDFAIELTERYGVAAIPVSVFYHNPGKSDILRFCFAKEDTTLEAAAHHLERLPRL
jgi:methionine aminotransferase